MGGCDLLPEGPADTAGLLNTMLHSCDLVMHDFMHMTSTQCNIEDHAEGALLCAQVVEAFEGVDVELTVDGSGAGRGGEGQKDVLPPLMPGMKARQQARSS